MKNLRKLLTLAVSLTMCLSISSAASAVTVNSNQKAIALQLTTTCENSTTKFAYNYAEKLPSFDKRGITFGCIGFTTGTYDGNILIHHYTKLNPDNSLAKYIPALDRIDKEEHDGDGKNNDIKGLENFINDVENCKDPLFNKAQLDELDEMYWNPAVSVANSIGAKNQLTVAFIYDMCVNHGEDGAKKYINSAKKALGGTPKDGVDENKFLSKVMDYRYEFLKKDDPDGSDRVNAYRKLLKAGNIDLKPGFKFTVYGENFNINGDVY